MGANVFPEWMGKYPRACAPWTAAEEQELVAGYKAGASLRALCAKHGRNTGGVNSRLAKNLGANFCFAALHPPRGEFDADIIELWATLRRCKALLKDIAHE